MKSKDILSRLNDEIDGLVAKTPSENITSTPIKVARGEKGKVIAPKRPFVKTRIFQAMCACLVCIALVVGITVPVVMNNNNGGVIGGGNNQKPVPVVLDNATTFVKVDINPSLEYIVDKKGKVTKVISGNSDGDVMLSDATFKNGIIGKNIDDAIDSTIDQALRLGYIDAKNVLSPKVVRMSVASDSNKNANHILNIAKESATKHLKDNGILMKVGGKISDKNSILQGTSYKDIDEYNEALEDEDEYYFINNMDGKNNEELLELFKNEFMGEYVEDAIDEIFEDVEDVMSIVAELSEALEDLDIAINENLGSIGAIGKDYWDYVNIVDTIENEDIKEAVLEVTKNIDRYNELLIEDSLNDNDYIDISTISVFKPIPIDKVTGSFQIKVLTEINERYLLHHLEIENFIDGVKDRIEQNYDNIQSVMNDIDAKLTLLFGEASKIAGDINKLIDNKIDGVIKDIDSYMSLCREKISSSYDKLVALNKDNKSDISPDDYDDLIEDLFGDDFDADDFD